VGPDLENRVGDQDIGSSGRPVSSVLPVPGELGHCCARTRPLCAVPHVQIFMNGGPNPLTRDAQLLSYWFS
jgi:hypothetical protein